MLFSIGFGSSHPSRTHLSISVPTSVQDGAYFVQVCRLCPSACLNSSIGSGSSHPSRTQAVVSVPSFVQVAVILITFRQCPSTGISTSLGSGATHPSRTQDSIPVPRTVQVGSPVVLICRLCPYAGKSSALVSLHIRHMLLLRPVVVQVGEINEYSQLCSCYEYTSSSYSLLNKSHPYSATTRTSDRIAAIFEAVFFIYNSLYPNIGGTYKPGSGCIASRPLNLPNCAPAVQLFRIHQFCRRHCIYLSRFRQ